MSVDCERHKSAVLTASFSNFLLCHRSIDIARACRMDQARIQDFPIRGGGATYMQVWVDGGGIRGVSRIFPLGGRGVVSGP